MSDTSFRILVTGASGRLGRLVVGDLLRRVPPDRVVAAVRRPDDGLGALGIEVVIADYDQPDTLRAAFAGIGRALLISSPSHGRRVAQHTNAIAAAKQAGVSLLAYTSVLRADRSVLGIADDHRRTEEALRVSRVPFALLRNSWYTENYTAALPAAVASGTLIGCAGTGRIAAAARADYAAAAAAVLTAPGAARDQTHELAGDAAFTLAELAAEVTRQSGRTVGYRNMTHATHRAALAAAGLPAGVADLVASSDAAAEQGALFDDGRQLSALIGRPTTTLAASVAEALAKSATTVSRT